MKDMKPINPALRRAITQVLAQKAGDGRNVEDLVAAIGQEYAQLTQGLAPLIGEVGVDAIFIRSVKLTRNEFPFLDVRRTTGPSTGLLNQLEASLREQQPATVREAATALFTTFAGLLVSFIGENLAWQLLGAIWPDAFQRETGSQEKTA